MKPVPETITWEDRDRDNDHEPTSEEERLNRKCRGRFFVADRNEMHDIREQMRAAYFAKLTTEKIGQTEELAIEEPPVSQERVNAA